MKNVDKHKPFSTTTDKPFCIWGMTATEFYDLANKRFFKGKLPKLKVKWTHPTQRKLDFHDIGMSFFTKDNVPTGVCLNPRYRNSRAIWPMTLLHEMVHIEQNHLAGDKAHGPEFVKRMRKLASQGAFDPFW